MFTMKCEPMTLCSVLCEEGIPLTLFKKRKTFFQKQHLERHVFSLMDVS